VKSWIHYIFQAPDIKSAGFIANYTEKSFFTIA